MASITVTFNNAQVMSLTLTKDVYVIGRHPNSDIHIDNLGISRSHARLLKEGDGYAVEDMNSANGTFVNETQVTRRTLREGDVIHIGKYSLFYHGDAPVNAKPVAKTVAEVSPINMEDGALCTMAMDGDAMRKKILEMQRQRDEAAARELKETETKEIARKPEPKAVAMRNEDAKPPLRSAAEEEETGSSVGLWIGVGVLLLAAVAAAVYFLVLKS